MFWGLAKHVTWLKYMVIMFISRNRMLYLCNMKFLYQMIDDAFSCCDVFCKVVMGLCYIKRCCLPPSVISYRLNCFLMVKNVGDLVRNFSTQTFASLHLFLSMIFDESNSKHLIASQRRHSTKKEEHLEICCF